MTQDPSDELYRQLHKLWCGEELVGRISVEMKLRLLASIELLTPDEEASFRAQFGQLLERRELKLSAEDATRILARIREIELRALGKMRKRKDGTA